MNEQNASIENLVYVIEESQRQIGIYLVTLESARLSEKESILRSIQKECATLSSAATRLSGMADQLPVADQLQVAESQNDTIDHNFILALQGFMAKTQAICRDCDKILPQPKT